MPPKGTKSAAAELVAMPSSSLPTPALQSRTLRMSYRIARGEQGVLTFEPYKGYLLPLWRFKTAPIAQSSSEALKSAFDTYVTNGDLVGADMARKFIQMGMTRAKRYANHKGGKKYNRSEREIERDGGTRVQLPRSDNHEGRDEKLQASNIFREVWKNCMEDKAYLKLREAFLEEQKIWDRDEHDGDKDSAASS
ncbi:hypothetical protein AMS68_005258 [Peltaster fructicola]|uniref:DUF4385 domain-containing protein n=1 Tax=Peltaster fructicola TaxID=286661 RepID=A0A6H0XYK1_9PEZI|nr:hypothetical protein AMS68_005258 [Peltaster fructicola]